MGGSIQNTDDQTHLLIFNKWVMVCGHCAYFTVIFLLYLFYRPVVPGGPLNLWLFLSIIIAAYIVIFDIALFLRNPDEAELLSIWRRMDKKHTMLFDAIAVGAILLLLPYGGEEHRLITLAFAVGYVPMQMISDPENIFGNQFSIISVLGAYILYLVAQGQTYSYILATFMVIYGAMLFFASDAFRSVVFEALRNRQMAEAASQKLEIALAEVSAERDAKTRFISAVSHDLGQPLYAAQLFGEQLIGNATEPALIKAENGLARALDNAQKMLRNLLHHMRLEADIVTPNLVQINLHETLNGMAEQYAAEAALAGMKIKYCGGLCLMTTDPVLLERAIGNLIHNAIIHSGGSKLLLGQRTASKAIEIWAIDNGVGIVAGEESIIFQDYVQGKNSKSSVRGGFGLGLASVRRLARLLGGEVMAIRRRNCGAAFRLIIPINAKPVL